MAETSRSLLKLASSLSMLAAAVTWAIAAATPVSPDAIARPATQLLRTDAAVLLGAAHAGSRIVAVGERGIVLLSDDGGNVWRQAAASPTSVTLTSVRFASPQRGWASGHAGTLFVTDDGGEHWRVQLDGKSYAQALLGAAHAGSVTNSAAGDSKAAARAVAQAERLVADGPDKPFFDLWFADDRRGYAVGAYNLFARTDDGGAHWQPVAGLLPNPKESHLHTIRGRGDLIFIAGEQGLLLRSVDGGRKFEALASPYAGSFFTLEIAASGEVIVAGLRGNAFRSTDRGSSWQPITGMPPVTWIGSAVSADGTLWLANQAGQIFASRDAGLRWEPASALVGTPGAPLTSLLEIGEHLGSQRVLTTTVRGFGRAAVAASTAPNAPVR